MIKHICLSEIFMMPCPYATTERDFLTMGNWADIILRKETGFAGKIVALKPQIWVETRFLSSSWVSPGNILDGEWCCRGGFYKFPLIGSELY